MGVIPAGTINGIDTALGFTTAGSVKAGGFKYKFDSGVYLMTNLFTSDGFYWWVASSLESFTYTLELTGVKYGSRDAIYNGKTYYWAGQGINSFSTIEFKPATNNPAVYEHGQMAGIAGYMAVHGDSDSAKVSIPVLWHSQYSTEPYQASFEITVV